MGRRRITARHLPWRMYAHRGGYRYVPPRGKPVWLGTDYTEALRRYAELAGPEKDTRRPLRTMGDLLERYEAEVVPTKAPATQRTNLDELAQLRKPFARMLPRDVKPVHIYAYMDRRPPVRANREKALLSHVFSYAIEWGIVEANPCRGVRGRKEVPRDRYVTDAEFWSVYDLAPPAMQVAMLLAASCGLRASELRALRWEQVREGHIEIQRGKRGKRQRLVINATVAGALDQARTLAVHGKVTRLTPHVLVTRDGTPFTASGLTSAWRRLMARYPGEPFRFHDLRAKSGSDHATGKHLGHQEGRTLEKHYRRKPEVVEVVDIVKRPNMTNEGQ